MDFVEPVLVKFTNTSGRRIELRVGQGPRIPDRVYSCDPGGIMEGPVNYTAFFKRNGLSPVSDQEIESAKAETDERIRKASSAKKSRE